MIIDMSLIEPRLGQGSLRHRGQKKTTVLHRVDEQRNLLNLTIHLGLGKFKIIVILLDKSSSPH